MHTTKRYLSLSALAAALVLAGCGATGGADTISTMPPSPEQGTAASASTAQEATTEHNMADVMFAQMMIPHHQQAVEMSEMMLAKDGISAEVTDLATRIKDAQGPEIETMTGWLEAWGEPTEPKGGAEGHDMGDMGGQGGGDSGSMGGMISEDQMADLDYAEGAEASRLFLESMTAHHECAIQMARKQIDNGQNAEVIALADTIVETQEAEIQEMQALLAGL
ncbi:DUF305 domain-containing protein [Arthrobacter frigidicola]|nr:DUF305 domain-containing protein [Arthrobacter frigidicola]